LVEAAPPRVAEPEPPAHESETAKGGRNRTAVPDDLIADIEAFKREVRSQEAGRPDARKKEAIAPQDLRLPKKVRERLPEFIMSAHIYDQDPAKRFVLINGLKTREGEETREDITVEQILPDGAVLSFEGNRFFRHR
jgi:general secretion pathway protein B